MLGSDGLPVELDTHKNGGFSQYWECIIRSHIWPFQVSKLKVPTTFFRPMTRQSKGTSSQNMVSKKVQYLHFWVLKLPKMW